MQPDILWHLGGGVIAGLAVGLALKQALRWALIALGLLLLVLMGLTQTEVITVNWDTLGNGVHEGATFIGGWVELALADLSAQFVGFSAGLLLGWRWK